MILVTAATVFGMADQFLGARASVLGFWAIDTSLLSAPWLLVAFVAGWSQETAKRALFLGLACTFAALAGYWAMTLSPVEGAEATSRELRGLLLSNSALIGFGFITGPLFGWFGQRWRSGRERKTALVAALAVCCEPLAHAAAGTAVTFSGVWAAETAAGVLLVLYVVIAGRRRRAEA